MTMHTPPSSHQPLSQQEEQHNTHATITSYLERSPIVLFMKGTPTQPLCGFSAQVVHILHQYGVPFFSVDVLSEPLIRAHLPSYSQWPTFPQLFIQKELIGGCDIVQQLQRDGSLASLLAPFFPQDAASAH